MGRIQVVLVYAVVIILFYFFITGFLEHYKLQEITQRVRPIHFIPQIILALLFGLINYFIYNQILKLFKIKLCFEEWFGLGVINTIANYIFPFKTGAAVKALYLKNKHNFSMAQNTSILVYSGFLYFFMIAGFSFITFAFMKCKSYPLVSLNLFLGLSCILTIGGLTFSLFIRRLTIPTDHPISWVARIYRILNLFLDGLKMINRNRWLLYLLVFANSLIFLIQSLRLYFAYWALDVHPSLLEILFINLLYCFSSLFVITPGNLGVQEIIIALASGLMGISKEEGLVAAGIIRLTAIVILTILSIFFYFKLNVHQYLGKHRK